MTPESWGCGRLGVGGDRSPSLAAAEGRGREAPRKAETEEEEEEEWDRGARAAAGTLGPGERLSARSWLSLGSPGSKLRPFFRLPPSPLPSPSSLRPPWTWAAGCRREGQDANREAPAGGGAAPRAAAPRPKGVRPGVGGRTGGSGRPQPPTPL